MRDIWNRPLKMGDLVLYNSRYYVVISENSLFSINGYIENNVDSVYLIENPIEQEKLLSLDFTNKYNDYIKTKLEHEKLKKTQSKENKLKATAVRVGDVVKEANSYNSTRYLYLGEGSYTDYDGKSYSGHLYIKVYSDESHKLISLDLSDSDTLKKLFIFNYHRVDYRLLSNLHSVLDPLNNRLIKSFKNKSNKLVEVCHHIDLSNSTNLSSFYLYDRYDYSPDTYSYHYVKCWEPVEIKLKNI